MLVNAGASSVDAPYDGGTSMGSNGTVGGTQPGGTSVGEISVILFVLSAFDIGINRVL